MNSCILFLFEGEKTEKMIYTNMKINFFKEKSKNEVILFATYKAEIFQLWNLIDEKYGRDHEIDLIEVLKERGNEELRNISRDQVTEIHLFFDHDAHSHLDTMDIGEYNKVISEMLNYFCDEYDQGKLWISYPMAEAIKHCKKDPCLCFENCIVDIKSNTDYKKLVDNLSEYRDIRKFNISDWYYFIIIAIQKINCLFNGVYVIQPDHEIMSFDQTMIHEKQMERFINTELKVAVLSAFPVFLLYFFGEPIYKGIQKRKVKKECKFCCLC